MKLCLVTLYFVSNLCFNWLYRIWSSFLSEGCVLLDGGRDEEKVFFFHKYSFGLRQNLEIRESVPLTVTSYHLALPPNQWA